MASPPVGRPRLFRVALFLACLFFVPSGWPQSPGLADILDGVSRRLDRMDDLSADFVHIYQDPLNQTVQEEGHLYLRRPRMMRWEYRLPEGKVFVTDGETVDFYLPDQRQVNRYNVDDTFDDRIPIMFLLGRSDLEGEFIRISLLGVEPKVAGARVLRMYPRRESDVEEVLLEVDPATFDIRRLRLTYGDQSISEFLFDSVLTNTGLDRSLFDFVPPADAEVVEGFGQ